MMLQKLKSKAGESLVESMAAILVFTFASIIMMSMVSAGADINTTAKNIDRAYQEQMVVAERGKAYDDPADPTDTVDPHTSAVATFHFGSVSETVSVDVFQSEEDALYAYYKAAGAPTQEESGE